ncbi:MAG: hypothetical protein M9921_13065 [Fimbriimonadaceae bacterium]|nr:hypothetical protein [Fimbriimonadaceae bacterium]
MPRGTMTAKAQLAADYRALASANRDLAASILRYSPTDPRCIRAAEDLAAQAKTYEERAEQVRRAPVGTRFFA